MEVWQCESMGNLNGVDLGIASLRHWVQVARDLRALIISSASECFTVLELETLDQECQ